MIIWPLRAFSATPLTSILTVSSAIYLSRDGRLAVQVRGALHDGATFMLYHVLEFGPKVLQETLHGPRRGVAQRAHCVSSMRLATSSSNPKSSLLPSPAIMRFSMRSSQPVPSRQGVHCPQDSDI